MPAVVELQRVTIRYGSRTALKDVNATFAPGAVGLLGPNGAGKTTMIRALLGFVVPNEGTLTVLERNVASDPLGVRARIGYMPENDAHIPGMTAVSFVAFCGELAGLPRGDAMQRAHEVLFYVGLGEARYRNVETYSTGMKQRIKLAQALVHDPDLLFLDEPTNGMDPKGREEMLALIVDIVRNKGLNVILSSHLMPDVEQTCEHLVVLDQGTVVQQGRIKELKDTGGSLVELRVKGDAAPFVAALAAAGFQPQDSDDDVMRVFVPDGTSPQGIFALAASHRVQVRHFRASVETLEDVFVKAVGEA